jgi:hypothetical protein
MQQGSFKGIERKPGMKKTFAQGEKCPEPIID